MNITKEQIAQLEDGQQLSSPNHGSTYVQRLRNYGNQLKTDAYRFKVKSEREKVTVTRIATPTPDMLTDKLRAMKPGEVCHPCESRLVRNVSATVAHLGGGFRVRTVVEVTKL